VTWWRALVSREARPGADGHPAVSGRAAELSGPPLYESLAGSPELQALVLAIGDVVKVWSADPMREARAGIAFPLEAISDAAEDVAARTGAALSDLNATVTVLSVRGQWSYAAGADYALCSAELAAGPDAGALLTAVFTSALPGGD
jgi:hypothetical protein